MNLAWSCRGRHVALINSHTANLLRWGRGGQQWGGRKGEKVGSEGLLLLKFLFLFFLLFFFSTIVTIFSIGCLHFMCPGIVLGACFVDLMQDRHPDPLCLWSSSKDGSGFPVHGWFVKSEFCWVPQRLLYVKYALLSSWNSLAVPRAPGGEIKTFGIPRSCSSCLFISKVLTRMVILGLVWLVRHAEPFVICSSSDAGRAQAM